MTDASPISLYQAFGRLVHLHRKRREGMTQENLGHLVGLSRTSITNIEKGRQHVSLHQLFAIAEALRVPPDALLPTMTESTGESSVAKKLPPDTEPAIADWAEKLVSGYAETEIERVDETSTKRRNN